MKPMTPAQLIRRREYATAYYYKNRAVRLGYAHWKATGCPCRTVRGEKLRMRCRAIRKGRPRKAA